MAVDYQAWYESARAELEKLQAEQAELERAHEEQERKIAELVKTVNFLAPLVGQQTVAATPPAGMTDCIRDVLKDAPEPLTAAEIREKLEALGFDMKSYSNPLATIHTVLRRLTEADEVVTMHESSAGRRAFMPLGHSLGVEKIAGKEFKIGGRRGFVGIGRLRVRKGANRNKEGR